MSRKLSGSWIDTYVKLMGRFTESPQKWNFWCGVAAIQATLKRKVFVTRGTYKLFPNDYHILIGRPGLGKGAAINPVVDVLKRANTANVLSDKLTIEYILDKLSKGFPNTVPGPNGGVTFGMDTTCIFCAPELSVFLRFPDNELADLCELWDAKTDKHQYGTRFKGLYEIENPAPTMLGGCAPEWLVRAVPPHAVGGGFTRRVNFIYYDGTGHIRKPWPEDHTVFHTETEPLVNDLRCVAQMVGEIKFDSDARRIFEKIYLDSDPNKDYGDEATCNYMCSRWAHVVKTAVAISAAQSDKMVLCKCDMEEAIEAVQEVTESIKIVFRSVGESDLASAADKVLQFLERAPGATYRQILGQMWKDVTKDDLQVILMTLRDGGIIDEKSIGGTLVYTVVPVQTKTRVTFP